MDLESRLRLERDRPVARRFLEERGGGLTHRPTDGDGLFWAVLQPSHPGTAPFVARVEWTRYPDHAPSVRFVAEIDGANQQAAWPAAPGFRVPTDICKPYTAEGQAVHPEWAAGPHAWRPEGNPFLFVLQNLQDDIDRVGGRRAA